MKNGKVSDTIYRRSILKNISSKHDESALGDVITVAQTIVDKYNQLELTAVRTLYRCVNGLWARGATPTGVQLMITLSDRVSEKKLADTIKAISSLTSQLQIDILGGHTEVSDEISRSVVSITAIGKVGTASSRSIDLADQPQVIVTKWVALDATSVLTETNRLELEKRLPAWLLDEAGHFDRFLSVQEEARVALDNGALMLKPLGSKGIFGGLWELGQSLGCGMEIGLRDIPIRQETIEICELLDINPYEVDSCGALMIVAKEADEIVERLKEAGITATIIGKLNASNDRVLISGDERRFIDKT